MYKLFFIIFLTSSLAKTRIIESVKAIVNDTIITLSDIKDYKKRLRSGAMVDDLLTNPKNIKALLADSKALIDVIINERLLESEVKKQGLEVTVERVEKEIRKISSRNGLSRNQLVSALTAQGVSFSDYQNFIKTRIERQSLVEKTITSKIKISGEEISAFYISKSGGSDSQTREITVAHIFVNKDVNERKKSLKKIRLVLKKLKNGENFETLASQYSDDKNFTQGGLLGTFRTGELVGSMEQALKSLSVGENSDVVETKRGYHILKILKQPLISSPAFEKEKGRIRAVLYQRAFKKQFKFWMDKKRREAFIRINNS